MDKIVCLLIYLGQRKLTATNLVVYYNAVVHFILDIIMR